MPWKECSVMDERLQFVGRRLAGEPMAELCREFGISRKTDWIRAKAPAIQYVLWLRTKTNWVRRSLHDYCRV